MAGRLIAAQPCSILQASCLSSIAALSYSNLSKILLVNVLNFQLFYLHPNMSQTLHGVHRCEILWTLADLQVAEPEGYADTQRKKRKTPNQEQPKFAANGAPVPPQRPNAKPRPEPGYPDALSAITLWASDTVALCFLRMKSLVCTA